MTGSAFAVLRYATKRDKPYVTIRALNVYLILTFK